MSVKTIYKEASESFGGLYAWQAVCDVCKGYIDLTQGGNPSQLQALMIKNHKYCGQGWDKQFSLIKEKHHYQCKCEQCMGETLTHGVTQMESYLNLTKTQQRIIRIAIFKSYEVSAEHCIKYLKFAKAFIEKYGVPQESTTLEE